MDALIGLLVIPVLVAIFAAMTAIWWRITFKVWPSGRELMDETLRNIGRT